MCLIFNRVSRKTRNRPASGAADRRSKAFAQLLYFSGCVAQSDAAKKSRGSQRTQARASKHALSFSRLLTGGRARLRVYRRLTD